MGGRRLVTYVHVRDESGLSCAFGPDDDVPGWAASQIGEHAWETAPESAPADALDGGSAGAPPRSGKGADARTWELYARANGVTFEDGAGRDKIIAACVAAGIIEP
jgi:hypothetical protein